MRLQTAIALWVSLLLPPVTWADTLVLDNGRELEGVVVDETESTVVFKLKTGSQITLPLSGIQNLVRSVTSELFILEGDTYLEKKEYEKAYEAYRKALQASAGQARERLKELDRTLNDEVNRLTEGLNLDEAEVRIRKALDETSDISPYWRLYRSRLNRILSEKGKRSLSKRSPELAIKNFSEDWLLDPFNGDFGEEYLEALETAKASKDTIIQFLVEYTQRHPDQVSLSQELALRIWRRKPCEAADLLAPAGVPPQTTKSELVRVLPEVFRKCFFDEPFPEFASLARTEYYQIYLELEPDGDRSPLYDARIDEDPDSAALYTEYAAYLIERKRSEEAEAVYRRLLAIEPNSLEAKEFLREWGIVKEKIAFQEEAARIRELERPYQLVTILTTEDFPLIKDSNQLDDLLRMARGISSVLEKRPSEMDGRPSGEALHLMKIYRDELEAETMTSNLKHLLSQTDKVNAKLSVEDKAPDFSLTDLEGNPVALSDFLDKVVLLHFWATWCPACRQEIPFVANTQEMIKDQDFQIIGMSLDTDRSALVQFLQANPKINWPQTFDGKGWNTPAALVYGVNSTPSNFLIDKEGTIRFINPRGQDLFNGILQLLSEDPGVPRAELQITGSLPGK